MGREFASTAARWFHLPDTCVRPEIVAICRRNLSPENINWFKDNIPTIKQITDDYRELLDNHNVEAVYISVPHNLHQEFYCAALKAGKHLMGEKPFGIDKKANDAIMTCIGRQPDLFIRCSSQFMFFPAVQRIGRMIEAGVDGITFADDAVVIPLILLEGFLSSLIISQVVLVSFNLLVPYPLISVFSRR